jgi:hypothetical protein
MGRLSAALIVDADPKGLEALTYGFEGDGCRVASTGAYASVPPMLSGPGQPQLAVVVLREQAAPGVALIRGLRDSAPTRNLPLLVLGAAALEAEVRAAAPGVDFLLLPVFVRDALTAGKMLIAMHEVNPGGAPETDIEGSLSDYGLFFLVRTMIGLGRSGILHLERGNRRGEIRFSEGEVTAAQVGSLQGAAALHHLLLWEEAGLSLKLRPVVHRGTFKMRPEDLIDEAERFLRDFAHATKDLGPTRRVLVADPDKATRASDSIPAEVVPVVRLFDGQRTLSDVIEDSPFRVFDTLRIVARLQDLGILATAQEGAGAAPAKLPNGAPGARPAAAGLADWLKPAPAAVVPPGAAVPEPAVPASADPTGPLEPGAVTPAAPHGRDLRSGPSNRRKTKRERTTADLTAPRFRPLFERPSGSMSVVTPAPATGAPPAAAAPAAPAGPPVAAPAAPIPVAVASAAPSSPVPPPGTMPVATPPPGTAPLPAAPAAVAAGELRAPTPAQGTLRGELRATARASLAGPAAKATAPAAPSSVMVDEAAATGAGVAATAGGSLTPPPAPTPPPSFAPPPATVLPGSVPLTMHKAKTHAVGVVEGPSRKTNGAAPVTAPAEPAAAGGSIQLDPALMAEMAAIDLANVPPTPPPALTGAPPTTAAAPAAPAAPAAAPATATSAGRPPTGAPAAVVSFVKGEGGRAAAQARAAATAATPRAGGAQPGRPAAVAELPGPATPPPKIVANAGATVDARQAATANRRPSSEFSALESDFFAREADLFKEEEAPAESFDDLDRRRRR